MAKDWSTATDGGGVIRVTRKTVTRGEFIRFLCLIVACLLAVVVQQLRGDSWRMLFLIWGAIVLISDVYDVALIFAKWRYGYSRSGDGSLESVLGAAVVASHVLVLSSVYLNWERCVAQDIIPCQEAFMLLGGFGVLNLVLIGVLMGRFCRDRRDWRQYRFGYGESQNFASYVKLMSEEV